MFHLDLENFALTSGNGLFRYPKLAEGGAFSEYEMFTSNDLGDIVELVFLSPILLPIFL